MGGAKNIFRGFLLVFMGVFSALAQPANDTFANRTAIVWPGTNVTFSGTLSNTTFETGEPFLDGISSGQTAWWTWTAPSNGIVTLSVAGTGFSPLLTVYAGTDFANLSLVASNNYLMCYENTNCGCHWHERSSTAFHVTRGQAYQFGVDSAVVTDASWKLEQFPSGEAFPAGAVRAFGPALPVLINGQMSWYVNVYVPVHTTNIIGGGEILCDFQFTPAPVNDDFENRTGISGVRTHLLASNVAADKQPGEPNHCGNIGGSSVWYSWQAPASGRVTFSTNGVPPYLPPSWYGDYSFGLIITLVENNGVGAQTMWNFYAPTCGAEIDQTPPPPPFYPLLAAYTGTNVSSLVSANALPFLQDAYPHAIEFDVVKGQTYQLAFDGNLGTTGTIPLFQALTTPSSNDQFKNRIRMRGINITATGFNAGATHEAGEPSVAGSIGKSVWWSWTAPASGPVSIDLGGSEHSFPVGVFSGSSVTHLNWIATGSGSFAFNALQGQTYDLAVNDASGLTGAIKLKLQAPVIQLPLERIRVRPDKATSGKVALLSFSASPRQIVLLLSSNDGSTWKNIRMALARQTTVDFLVRAVPTSSGPFYRAIVVDYQ